MTDLPIRPATDDDHDRVVETTRLAYAKYVERMGREPAPMTADYHAAIATGTLSVVDRPGPCQGLIQLYPALQSLFVETVAVHPRFQGSGVGSALMAFAEAEAHRHGLATITLYTNAKMVENIAYYQRRGFAVTGRKTENGFDRIYFEKRL